MSKDWYQDVLNFHKVFDHYIGDKPSIPNEQTQMLRLDLLEEEYDELCDAIHDDDLTKIADGVADLIYVAVGAAISYGIDLRPVWDEVQRTNMAKVGGKKREDGKMLKPEGWKPPDIKGILEKQCVNSM